MNDAHLAFDVTGSDETSFVNFTLGTFGLGDETFEALRNRWTPRLDALLSKEA